MPVAPVVVRDVLLLFACTLRVEPAPMVMSPTDTVPVSVTLSLTDVGITTLSPAAGTPLGVQLVAVDQLLIPPLHVLVTAQPL